MARSQNLPHPNTCAAQFQNRYGNKANLGWSAVLPPASSNSLQERGRNGVRTDRRETQCVDPNQRSVGRTLIPEDAKWLKTMDQGSPLSRPLPVSSALFLTRRLTPGYVLFHSVQFQKSPPLIHDHPGPPFSHESYQVVPARTSPILNVSLLFVILHPLTPTCSSAVHPPLSLL